MQISACMRKGKCGKDHKDEATTEKGKAANFIFVVFFLFG